MRSLDWIEPGPQSRMVHPWTLLVLATNTACYAIGLSARESRQPAPVYAPPPIVRVDSWPTTASADPSPSAFPGLMLCWALGLAAAMGWGALQSHRLAGSLLRIRKALRAPASGEPVIRLRKSHESQELAEDPTLLLKGKAALPF